MEYFKARLNQEIKEAQYRFYLTDTLFYYTQGKALTMRFEDLINRKPDDKRSAEDIISDVVKKAGITVNKGE